MHTKNSFLATANVQHKAVYLASETLSNNNSRKDENNDDIA